MAPTQFATKITAPTERSFSFLAFSSQSCCFLDLSTSLGMLFASLLCLRALHFSGIWRHVSGLHFLTFWKSVVTKRYFYWTFRLLRRYDYAVSKSQQRITLWRGATFQKKRAPYPHRYSIQTAASLICFFCNVDLESKIFFNFYLLQAANRKTAYFWA